MLPGDARSLILDGDGNKGRSTRVKPGNTHFHSASGPSIFDGVMDEVYENLRQFILVAQYRDVTYLRLDFHLNVRLGSHRFKRITRLGNEFINQDGVLRL